MKAEYIIGGVLVILVAAGLIFILLNSSGSLGGSLGPYKEIVNPSGFVNTDGITVGELIGKKVVLIDFMTYSCINCQRTFPYLNAWYERYKDQGLEIIGIHTPEFAFERDIDNVREAMRNFGIMHPVVLDNNYATWNAYGNIYWPRKYLIDIHGEIVYDHIGEGAYEETEMKIRELLEERAGVLGEAAAAPEGALASDGVTGARSTARSPETYFGSDRNEHFANGDRFQRGEQNLELPGEPVLNRLYLGGTWDIQPEYARSVSEGVILYRYNGMEVYLVADADSPVDVEVWQDGQPVGTAGGEDVNDEGIVTIQESKLYKLIKNDTPGEHILELRVRGGGMRAYAFTFG